ncbi:MAG: GNAT family N-acetyltransferase [Actinobacteria bacterium HGW-Actinobacteria-7]|jgi:ribosomal-protein-alanine N-acetyltransferase|nr:MAG: GNAT family N-acetyltransferase [Actinobacteria bacterium HGW-Actinobacteria-7]
MERADEFRTERLLLRRWGPGDREAFSVMNSDPRVMEFLPALLSREQSDVLADRFEAHFDREGFGPWAVEVVGGPEFVGFVGLLTVSFEAHFTPAVEIGWRLASEQWGHGYATEAASAALVYGFDSLGLDEIVAFTVPANLRSQAVMERIGMVRDEAGDFDHPSLPEDSPLRWHVLYRRRSDIPGGGHRAERQKVD